MGLRDEIFECMDNALDNAGEESVKRDARLIAEEIVEQGGMPESLADDHDVDDETEYEDAVGMIEVCVLEWQARQFPEGSDPLVVLG